MADLQYPIGKFAEDVNVTDEKRRGWINEVLAAPGLLRKAVAGLTAEQLDTPYRPGGWTVRQVVHHLADSHSHVPIRFRLALTEDEPTPKGYDTNKWAELPDAKTGPIEPSLALFEAVHGRWALLLRSMTAKDFARAFKRPDGQLNTLDRALQTYVWHAKHHLAHVLGLCERMGWK